MTMLMFESIIIFCLVVALFLTMGAIFLQQKTTRIQSDTIKGLNTRQNFLEKRINNLYIKHDIIHDDMAKISMPVRNMRKSRRDVLP